MHNDRPRADFNGDGYGDFAIASLAGAVDGASIPGTVIVIYGSADGPIPSRHQHILQEGLRASLSAGNFDGDGYSDLAIGTFNNGVRVVYGSREGLDQLRSQFWSQESPGVLGTSEVEDAFGLSLASGNFGRGSQDDLAIGVPGEGTGRQDSSGRVVVLYGGPWGLTGSRAQSWSQNSRGIPGKSEFGDTFGASLAVGDYGRSGYDDLAISAPGENIGTVGDAGSVTAIYGSHDGLTSAHAQAWHQGTSGVPGANEVNDRFGTALAAGNLGRDSHDELAIGTPGEDIGTRTDAGSVTVLYSTSAGLRKTGSQAWSQDSPGIAEQAENGDNFGAALAIADFGRSNYRDLSVGAPGESAATRHGSVHILYGSKAGVTSSGDQFWTGEDIPDYDCPGEIIDPPRPCVQNPYPRFGAALAAGNFGAIRAAHAFAGLAIGAPDACGLRLGGPTDCAVGWNQFQANVAWGGVQTVNGSPTGINLSTSMWWTARQVGLPYLHKQFGIAFAASGQP